jgi:tetratricopeptide (TPR) repeat protein
MAITIQSAVAEAHDWEKTIREYKRLGATNKQLAVAYNNYALSLADQGEWSQAERNMRQAITLDPMNRQYKHNSATVYMNHAYRLAGDRNSGNRNRNSEAIKLAHRALEYRSNWADPYRLIGDLEYQDQRLDRAELAWQKAQQISPSRRIDARLAKLETEASVEKKLDRGGNAHFDLRFQKQLSSDAAQELTAGLMKARMDIGRQFKFWPDRRIVVLIYTPQGFKQVRRGPEWSIGAYDGKIRVPYPQADLAATLVHEFTHALVHDLTGNRCPRWLNEGLAEYQESKISRTPIDLLRLAVRLDRLLPIDQLDVALRRSDATTAMLAYQQSYSLVTYLVEKYQFFRMKLVLQHLGSGEPLDVALKRELFITSEQLERDWKEWVVQAVR